MSVQTEIARLNNAKSDLKTAIEAKGVAVPAETTLDGYGELVSQIPSGGGGKNIYLIIFSDEDISFSTGETVTVTSSPITIHGLTMTYDRRMGELTIDLDSSTYFQINGGVYLPGHHIAGYIPPKESGLLFTDS